MARLGGPDEVDAGGELSATPSRGEACFPLEQPHAVHEGASAFSAREGAK